MVRRHQAISDTHTSQIDAEIKSLCNNYCIISFCKFTKFCCQLHFDSLHESSLQYSEPTFHHRILQMDKRDCSTNDDKYTYSV